MLMVVGHYTERAGAMLTSLSKVNAHIITLQVQCQYFQNRYRECVCSQVVTRSMCVPRLSSLHTVLEDVKGNARVFCCSQVVPVMIRYATFTKVYVFLIGCCSVAHLTTLVSIALSAQG